MSFPAALVRFVPTDPGYAPFGWQRLRGMSVLPLALAALLGAWWAAEYLYDDVFDAGKPLVGWLPDFLSRMLIYEIVLLPTAAAVMLALNLSTRREAALRAVLLAAALLLGSLVFAATWIPVSCTLVAVERDWVQHCDPFTLDWVSFASLMRAMLSALLLSSRCATPTST
jgi:hypothetical protein